MVYDVPSNVTGVYSMLVYANYVTSGWFVFMMLLGITFVMLISLKAFTTGRAFTFSAIAGFILSVLLSAAGLLSGKIVIGYLVAAIIGILALWGEDG